jgi:lysyl-tRNA synthetase, class II
MEDHLLQVRLQKIDEMRQAGVNPYANGFAPSHTTADVAGACAGKSAEELEADQSAYRIAGRVVAIRDFGKSAFFHLQDRKGRIQAYVQKNRIGEAQFATFKKVDLGDFIGIEGRAFLTKTGEATVLADSLTMLTKSLHPLPEKWHGLQDVETRYRQRYLDLIANEDVRKTFLARAKIITLVRQFLLGKDFVEVETP